MFETLYDAMGIDAGYVVMAVPAIVVVVNFLKDVVEIKGKKQLLIAVGVLSFCFGFNAYPDFFGVFFTSLACFIGSVGAWKGVKKFAHKMGAPSSKEPD